MASQLVLCVVKRSSVVPLLRIYSVTSRHFASNASPDSETPLFDAQNDEDADVAGLRNISRLPNEYRDRMLHVLRPPEPPADYITAMHQTVAQKRRLYAKYGRKSGIDAGLLWPSMEQLEEQKAFEKDWEPTLGEMMKRIKEERLAEEKERREKRLKVEKQLAKMPQLIDEYRAKLTKSDEMERRENVKRQVLLEEAREFFGYNIDPKDPRFEKLKEDKEEQEKKLKKQKKKEEKAARLLAAIKK